MRLRTPGDRPPYTVLFIGLAMLAAYIINSLPVVTAPAAEILRDGPSPAAPWTRPSVEALLAGRACIPLSILLENRVPTPEHSFSVDIHCPKEGTQ